jgi:predicted HAD superfamily phosphohydrolase YqeG
LLINDDEMTFDWNKKPSGIESIQKHFNVQSCDKLILVGDRYLTDVYFGQLSITNRINVLMCEIGFNDKTYARSVVRFCCRKFS